MRLTAHHLFIALCCLALLGAKLVLLWRINVNWDEFLYLSKVYAYQRGALTTAFQTFHVHLFGWLTVVPGTEVDQVLAGRLAAFVLRVGTTVGVFLVALRLCGRTGAWIAALATLSFSYLLRHGESLRGDPLIAFLFVAALALMVVHPTHRSAVVGAAVLYAVALLVSVKALVYAPALAAVLVVAAARPGQRAIVVLFGVGVGVAYAALYLLHTAAVEPAGASVAARTVAAGAEMWLDPRIEVLQNTLRADWMFWTLFVLGVGGALVAGIRSRGEMRALGWLLIGLQLPLLSLVLYRNTYPYFFVVLVPVAALACGYAVARVEATVAARRPRTAAALVAALAAGLTMQAALSASVYSDDMVSQQREVLTAVHRMFPEPVPYIDRGGMVASFPHVGPFMSTSVLTRYRARGRPAIEALVREHAPAFLLANVIGLELHLDWDEVQASPHRLLRADFEFLQRNFVHHWGPLWVPGRTIDLTAVGDAVAFELPIAGEYTVDAGAAVVLDGTRRAPGDVVYLVAGRHTIEATSLAASVTLRLGRHLPVPAHVLPSQPLFISL